MATIVSRARSRNIQLINNRFGSNIDGRMKERSWKNEACGFINFEVIIKKPRWNVIKNHIPATKGSITSRNIEISLTKLKHSRKANCWRFVESSKWIADMKWEKSFYQNIDRLKTQIFSKQNEANIRFQNSNCVCAKHW